MSARMRSRELPGGGGVAAALEPRGGRGGLGGRRRGADVAGRRPEGAFVEVRLPEGAFDAGAFDGVGRLAERAWADGVEAGRFAEGVFPAVCAAGRDVPARFEEAVPPDLVAGRALGRWA
jgi:hypothetical protein